MPYQAKAIFSTGVYILLLSFAVNSLSDAQTASGRKSLPDAPEAHLIAQLMQSPAGSAPQAPPPQSPPAAVSQGNGSTAQKLTRREAEEMAIKNNPQVTGPSSAQLSPARTVQSMPSRIVLRP